MSIHKRERKTGTRYLVIITTKIGKQISKTFKRKTDAEIWERQQKQILSTDPAKLIMLERSLMILSEFCNLWIQKYAVVRKAPSSVHRDKRLIANQINPGLGRMKLKDLSQHDIEFWFNELSSQKLSPKTCNHSLGLLKKLLNDAVAWKYVNNNEARYVKPHRLQKAEPKFWTKDESVMFLTYMKDQYPDWYPVFVIALYTGMRRGEIRGLKWDCVDLQRKVIIVKRAYCDVVKKVREQTKGKTDRWVPINEHLMRVLVEQRNKPECCEFVAPSFDWLHSYRQMLRLCKEAGVTRIRFHDLRHTFASHLVMSGKPLYEVQKLLGHANYSMTEKYAHLSPEYLKGATDSLDFSQNGGAKILKMVC